MAVETQLLVRADVEQTTRRVVRTRGEGVPVREKLMTMVNHIWVPMEECLEVFTVTALMSDS